MANQHTRQYTDEDRAKALELYLQHGAATAAEQTGIPVGTITSWATRQGLSELRTIEAKRAAEGARLTWAQRRAQVALEAGEAAHEFTARARMAKPRDARDLMAAADMAVKNAQLLDGGPTNRVEYADPEQARQAIRKMRDELAERRKQRARSA